MILVKKNRPRSSTWITSSKKFVLSQGRSWKIAFPENGFGAHTPIKTNMDWDFRNSYKLWSPRIAGSTKKCAPRPPGCEFRFLQHPLDGNAIAKSHTFHKVFRWFSKVWKFRCIFCTPQAFWASHFSKVENWRSPNVTFTDVLWIVTTDAREVLKKNGIRIPTAAGRTFFCAPHGAWGCIFWPVMRILVRESQFWRCGNLEMV